MRELSPEQRELLRAFLVEAEEIQRFEYHSRRTDLLFSVSVIVAVMLATVLALTQDGVVAAVATGTLFPLGAVFGATMAFARQRRRSFEKIATMREIAELYVLYDAEPE
jgi:uncharacterized membrane protein